MAQIETASPVQAFKALSNANRLKVFEIIRAGCGCTDLCRTAERPGDIPRDSVCVCEILTLMDVTGPTLSHHLKELRNAGLVDVFQRGQWAYYAVRPGALDALADYFRCRMRPGKCAKEDKS
jgi:DNA-binding transcriptional ArsR family regulator